MNLRNALASLTQRDKARIGGALGAYYGVMLIFGFQLSHSPWANALKLLVLLVLIPMLLVRWLLGITAKDPQ